MSESLLTVAMATYKDFEGVYMTLITLREFHPAGVEVLVLDNAPTACGQTRDVTHASGGRYFHRPDLSGTSRSRDRLFDIARTPWVMVVDSHVVLARGCVEAALKYARDNPDSRDIIQGPMLTDNRIGFNSHWTPACDGCLWGEWHGVPAGDSVGKPPFEIPMQGLGLYMMRREAWPGFSRHFVGFGGEEGYVHEKVRQLGGKALCHPALRWYHRFRKTGVPQPYPRVAWDHAWNLLVGHRELGLERADQILKHHAKNLSEPDRIKLVGNAERVQPLGELQTPEKKVKLLGVWYSNNAAPGDLLQKSLATIRAGAESSRHDVRVATCSWEAVPGNPFPAVLLKPAAKGHRAILEQQHAALSLGTSQGFAPDAVVFLEHDVLYPADYFDRIGAAWLAAPPATDVVSNLDYIGLNQTGWLSVVQRHEPLHQLSMRYDAAVANMKRAMIDCEKQGWAYLEPDSGPAVARDTEAGLLAADFDGTLSAGWVPPSADFVVITGRLAAEAAAVVKVVGGRPVYYRPNACPPTDEAIAAHKADRIRELGVVEYWEDVAAQAEIIRRACPGVVVHHVSGPPAGPRANWVRLDNPKRKMPSVHVNHTTGRFTSHGEVCYAPDSGGTLVHPYWGHAKEWWPGTLDTGKSASPPKAAEKAAPTGCCGGAPDNPMVRDERLTLEAWHEYAAKTPSDFHEHMDFVRELAGRAASAAEVSAWNKPAAVALAAGCSGRVASYGPRPKEAWGDLDRLLGERFAGVPVADSAEFDLEPVDLLFLDTQHRAETVYRELARHHGRVGKWILVHCTETYGETGDDGGYGVMHGLRRFLKENPAWNVRDYRPGNHGLIVLTRAEEDRKPLPGLPTQAKNYLVAKLKKLVRGGGYIPLEMAEKRLEHCYTCTERQDDRCSRCGCYLEVIDPDGKNPAVPPTERGKPGRAFLPHQGCPIGKWHPIDPKDYK